MGAQVSKDYTLLWSISTTWNVNTLVIDFLYNIQTYEVLQYKQCLFPKSRNVDKVL